MNTQTCELNCNPICSIDFCKTRVTFKNQTSSRSRFSIFKLLSIFILVMFGVNVMGQTTDKFNDGYISLFKVTSGATLTNTASAIVIEQYIPTGASQSSANYSFAFPATAGPAANQVCISGTATSAGHLSRSENGRYLAVPGYFAALGAANTTFTTNGTVRLLNGSGTIGSGIQATTLWMSASNNLRGAATDDGTNYWLTGGTIGIQHANAPGTVTTVSTTATNTRNIQIYNGQLYFSTAASTNGVWKLGTGKPTTASTTATNLIVATGSNCFSVSPDGLTIYAFSSANQISRYTYSGAYSSNSYSGGTWSTASTGFTCTGAAAIAVNWTGYTFSATGTNGAVIYACSSTVLLSGSDNGTGAITTTTLRTISGNNVFRGLAFSPIKQSINIGANTPATGNINKGGADTVLFQMNLSADEGNSTVKKIVLATAGTAVLGTDISNFRIVDDANNDGAASAAEIAASFTTTGTVSGTNITFSSLLLSSYIAQGSSKNFLILGDVAAGATTSRTFIPSIASNNTINSITYTSNITNAGGSLVTMGTLTNAPLGNTLTIVAPSTSNVTLATTGTPSSANLGTGTGKLIYGFALTPSGGSVDFTALNITTAGTTTSSDISTFDLYLDADNSGTINSGDTLVKTVATLSNPLSFTSFTNAQTGLSDGTTYKYLIQATVAGSATNGRTITLSIGATSDITTNVTGSVSGTPAGNSMYVGSPSTTTDNSGTPSASNVTKAATDIVVFGFKLTPTGLASFSDLNIATAGTATNSDISNFRIYKDANSNGIYDNGTDVLLQTVSTLSSTLTFSSLAQTGLTSATKYLLLADIASGATTGRTFSASIAASGDITLGSGSNTGTAAGNQMTIDAGVYGDFRSNGTSGGVWSAAATWQTLSATGTWISASVTPTSISFAGKNVTIQSGDEVTVTGTSNYCKNLTIQGSGGKLFANSLITTFINVFGDITCNGTIGNGATYDAIGFDVEGATCTISGSGSFDASRIAKNSITSPASIATTLYFDMNANLRYGGTAAGSQSTNNTVIYVNAAGAILNIVINQNKTVTCYGDGTATSAAAISIDGVDGNGSGERGGSLTVNGTLDIQYNGTPAGTSPTYGLYLVTNNATSAVAVSIGATGTINTPRIVCSASGVAGHTFSIASGGVLNITQEPTSFVTPNTTNNTYSFNANSNINYTKTGNQTLYTFGPSVYQGNITLSGSGVKSVLSTGILNIAGTLTTAGLLTLKSDTNGTASIGVITTGTITGNVTVERYIPFGKRAYRLLSPSVTTTGFIYANWQIGGATTAGRGIQITGSTTDANGFDVTASGNPSMYTYQNNATTGTGWLAISNTNATTLNAGTGYRTLVRGDRNVDISVASTDNMNVATTLSATGTLKVGNVVFDSTTTPALNNTISTTSNPITNDFSLIGNPYASPVDWGLVTKVNVGDTYYTWDPNMGTAAQRGRYVAYSATSATNDVSGSAVSQYIQPGQAFFVKTTAASPVLTFKETDKATGFTNVFRTNESNTKFSISVYNPTEVAFAAPIDGTTAIFGTDFNATIGLGDAEKLFSAGESLAWSRGTKLLAIDAQAPAVANDELHLKTMQFVANKSYTFKINATNFDSSLTAFLVDQYLNTQTQVDLTTPNFVPFATTADAASYGADRFKVVFSPSSALNNEEWSSKSLRIYPNPVVDNQFTIAVSSSITDKVAITIYNIIGQSVYKERATAINNSIIVRPSAALKAGVYMVEMANNGKTSTQKIIIK